LEYSSFKGLVGEVSMRGRAERVPAWLLFVCSVSLPALSQTTGELTGTVADASSAAIPGALVEVRSTALIRPRQTSSNDEGRFVFPLLPPGQYSVLARMTGFNDAVETDVRIPLGETITLPMTLTLAASASVTVGSEIPLIDVTDARVGVSANETMLNNLPLGRNFASIASIVGGVGADIVGSTFFGASSLENSFVVDGLNVTGIRLGGQGKQVPLEFVQEVEVRSGGYEAEYGKALGGNINVLTRSGGNEVHGNLFGYYDSDSLGASDRHGADREAVLPSYGTSVGQLEVPRRYEVGMSLGGPVVRDRLWLFGAYDRALSGVN
jgi:hypothetical protein